jgi:hypothetical protein
MTTNDFLTYYAGLLIKQYITQPDAFQTIEQTAACLIAPQTTTETIVFSSAPASGSFVLNYSSIFSSGATAAINWNDSTATIQSKIQAITGLSSVTVSGTIAGLTLTVVFTGVIPPAAIFTVSSNTLGVTITVTETDEILPIAIANAFNLTGPNTAVGTQLDVLGKYAGVSRTGVTFDGVVTLDDSDFLMLIQLAVLENSSDASLATIQNLIEMFFPGDILVFDYQDMTMSYLISSSLGSQNFIEVVITEGLLPKPMGVGIRGIVFAPIITTFFGFRTYEFNTPNNSPFNSYNSYQTNRPWLSYGEVIVP